MPESAHELLVWDIRYGSTVPRDPFGTVTPDPGQGELTVRFLSGVQGDGVAQDLRLRTLLPFRDALEQEKVFVVQIQAGLPHRCRVARRAPGCWLRSGVSRLKTVPAGVDSEVSGLDMPGRDAVAARNFWQTEVPMGFLG